MANSMELFGALMQGQIPQRVPIACNLLDQGAREMNMSIEEYYSKGENVAKGQLLLYRKYGHDVVWGAHYVAREAEMLGSKRTLFYKNGPPNVGHMVIQNYSDIEKLVIPDELIKIEAFAEQKKTIEIIKHELNGEVPVCSFSISSFSLPPLLMGIDKWLELLFFGPKDMRELILNKGAEFNRKKIDAFREAGADLIAYSNPIATSTFLTDEQFDNIAMDWINEDVKFTGTDGLIYFNGGAMLNGVLDRLVEKSGFRVFHINPMDEIPEALKIINGRGLLIGTINDIMLMNWSNKEIEMEIQRIIDLGSLGGGFIFGTLLMPYMIPDNKIKHLIDSAKRIGRYTS